MPSQVSEPADDNNQEDEYGMSSDSIIDADLEVINTSGDTQEAEAVGAAQKDPPSGPSMKPFKKPNTQMKLKLLDQMLSTSFFHWRREKSSSLKKCMKVKRHVKNLRKMKTIISL